MSTFLKVRRPWELTHFILVQALLAKYRGLFIQEIYSTCSENLGYINGKDEPKEGA